MEVNTSNQQREPIQKTFPTSHHPVPYIFVEIFTNLHIPVGRIHLVYLYVRFPLFWYQKETCYILRGSGPNHVNTKMNEKNIVYVFSPKDFTIKLLKPN